MKLTTMTMNAIRRCAEEHGWQEPNDDAAWDDGPPKEVIAAIPYERVKRTYSLGKLGLADVVKWLAEDGLSMPGTPDSARRKQVSQARLDAATDLLRRHGYTVKAPTAKIASQTG